MSRSRANKGKEGIWDGGRKKSGLEAGLEAAFKHN
jgi:hypothetical protein